MPWPPWHLIVLMFLTSFVVALILRELLLAVAEMGREDEDL